MKDPCTESNSRDPYSFMGLGAICCSICLDAVRDAGDRAIAKLKCGHFFHLDCIGSAFNAKGSMQCPNCRLVEEGQWLYANCSCHLEDSGMDSMDSEAYEIFAGIIDILPYEAVHPRHLVRSFLHSYRHLSVVLEGTNPSSSISQGMSFGGSGGVPYSRAESSSPLQARRQRGSSGRMQMMGSSEMRTGNFHVRGSSQFSRTAPNVEAAATLPYERRRWSMPASGSRPSTSRNHVAPVYGDSSFQFAHTRSRGTGGSTSQPSRGTNMPYLRGANNQAQRVNNIAHASLTTPLNQGSIDNGRRSRQREWPPEVVSDQMGSLYDSSAHLIRDESVNTSGASVGWQSNGRRYPWARDRHPGPHQSSRDNARYLNVGQYFRNAQPAERMTSSHFLHRDFRGSNLPLQPRVEPECPFDENLTQHAHAHLFQHGRPSNFGAGPVQVGTPFSEPQSSAWFL